MDEKMLKMLNYPKEDCNCITCQRARRIKELEDVQEFTTKNIFFLQEELDKARTRIKGLEGGIKKVLQWRNLDGDGITDPLRMELYKLIGEEPCQH